MLSGREGKRRLLHDSGHALRAAERLKNRDSAKRTGGCPGTAGRARSETMQAMHSALWRLTWQVPVSGWDRNGLANRVAQARGRAATRRQASHPPPLDTHNQWNRASCKPRGAPGLADRVAHAPRPAAVVRHAQADLRLVVLGEARAQGRQHLAVRQLAPVLPAVYPDGGQDEDLRQRTSLRQTETSAAAQAASTSQAAGQCQLPAVQTRMQGAATGWQCSARPASCSMLQGSAHGHAQQRTAWSRMVLSSSMLPAQCCPVTQGQQADPGGTSPVASSPRWRAISASKMGLFTLASMSPMQSRRACRLDHWLPPTSWNICSAHSCGRAPSSGA